ncbi:hypothetical protein HY312_00335 [Candidatus Saccharibacteria bacterium]|nr:hypothetical protein [Candidatus Saccharibacteria bacterium]
MKRILIAFLCLIIIGAAVLFVIRMHAPTPSESRGLVSQGALNSLSKKDASGIDTSHLADGIIPPTNKWFSGIALQKDPKKVFSTPLSFLPTKTSFTIDLPSVQTTEKSIITTPSTPTNITIKDAQYYRITRYDELSVDLTYYDRNNTPLATATITSGSPYVFYHAKTMSTIEFDSENTKVSSKTSLQHTGGSTILYADAHDGATFTQSNGIVSSKIPKDGLVAFYSLPASVNPSPLKAASGARITQTSIDYKKTGDTYTTTISLQTANRQATVFGLLPHQKHTYRSLLSLDTIYGKQEFTDTPNISFSTPYIETRESLDLSKLTTQEKELLSTQLRHDINASQFTAEDTYFGGKQLYRGAQLLLLARQLNQPEVAQTMQQKLRSELITWLKPSDGRMKKVFYYDTKIKGIVGETASFGSQEFNDHHFHYGYFIYAASILAKYDSEFKEQYSDAVDLLVADIANVKQEDSFPLRRTFDPYFGHSWAGNNQESVSEALNAWSGINLWAKETNNDTLLRQADWLLSNEYQSAVSYWVGYDITKAPYTQNYTHTISPLNWGGKRDYATFFSAEPSAMLGILLIPMNPTMVSFKTLEGRISSLIDEGRANPGPTAQFSDYLLMLEGLRSQTNLLPNAQKLSDEAIDSANSRSYMYAWILSTKR